MKRKQGQLPIILFTLILITVVIMITGCSDPLSGGGTRGGNPVVTGMIIGLDGYAAADVKVSLITSDYNPVTDSSMALPRCTLTDADGVFSIEAPDSGMYSVEAVNVHDGSRLLRFNVITVNDSISKLPCDTLHIPGMLKVIVSGSTDGYLFVPGTKLKAFITPGSDTVTIDSVPATTLPALVSSDINSNQTSVLRNDIVVSSGGVTLIESEISGGYLQITLNTAQDGAAINSDVYDFPVLIRLDNTNFNFNEIKDDGTGLHFTREESSILPFEIERWDNERECAEIWVKVDTIYGNNSTQSIAMYWNGAGGSGTIDAGSAVFDTSVGFQGVWHLGDGIAGGQFNDATVNRFHGTSPDTAFPETGKGVIGNCAMFDGKRDFITMQNTADGTLNFPENSYYTVCAWARLDTMDNQSHCIVSKGFEQYYLRSTYISVASRSAPLWEFVEFSDKDKWQTLSTPASEKQWAFIVGVREGKKQFFYCNGVLVDTTLDLWPYPATRTTSNDLYIGRFSKQTSTPLEEGIFHFKGGIDEVRILNKAVNADWIKLCYMNQRTDDQLVVFQK